MSEDSLHKAIEELAEELLDRRDMVGAGELRRTAESAYEEVARFLRQALVKNPAPEVEWDTGVRVFYPCNQEGEIRSFDVRTDFPDERQRDYAEDGYESAEIKRTKGTAPGPWVLVEGDEENKEDA